MPFYGPITRRNLIKGLKQFGYEGPYSGGKHEYLLKNGKRLTIPNPHKGDISTRFLGELLKEAGIPKEEWENI